jgi:thiamine kinase-like enzyme
MFGPILTQYGIDESDYTVRPYGNGLINHTWKIVSAGKERLLQKINDHVFKSPADIMENCDLLSQYFSKYYPDYLFIAPLQNKRHQNFVTDEENNYFRLFPFVSNSFTINTVNKPIHAYEAARQFGKFTRMLSGFDAVRLKITLPDFHNLILRQENFESAVQNGQSSRISQSMESISYLRSQKEIVDNFEKIKNNPSFRQHVVHHDAKINNVLFELGTDRALCLIDLDTVMPGFYFSDVGDMLRTYLSPTDEEESDFDSIEIREEFFREIAKGYLEEMRTALSPVEISNFVYAGKFAIYMQAIRFLTDYLTNDRYYQIQYESQNLIRANNQVTLLKRFIEKERRLNNLLNSLEN